MHARLRMLMNAQANDGSPGGAPAAAGAPASPPSAGGGGDGDDVVGKLSKLIDAKLTEHRNGIFADLRKAGALGKGEKPQTSETPAAPQGAGQQSGMTESDVRRISQRERQFGAGTAGLTPGQTARLEKLFAVENPDDVGPWLTQTLADLGIKAGGAGTPAANPSANGGGSKGPPVTDTGGQANHVVTEDTPLIRMSADDRQHLINTKGLAWYRRTLQEQLKGSKVVFKKP